MQQDYSRFRGMAGEVVAGYVRPGTLLSAVPVLLFYAVGFGFMALAMPPNAFPFDALLLIAISAIPVARFALPAARGDLRAGWFNDKIERGETLAFAGRYVVLTVLWSLPVGLLGWLAQGLLDGPAVRSPLALGGAGLGGVITALLGLFLILAPVFSVIICTATTSVRDALSLDYWRVLLLEEYENLVTFYAALFGGVMVFWMLVAVPLLILVALLAAVSPNLGAAVGTVVLLLPAATAPILLGRLAGAFVSGADEGFDDADDPTPDDEDDAPSGVPASTAGAAGPRQAPAVPEPQPQAAPPVLADSAPERRNSVDRNTQVNLIARLDKTPAHQVENALLLAGNRLRNRPDDAVVAAEFALLNCRAKRDDAIVDAASRAIRLNLMAGNDALAGRLFIDAGTHRKQLQLMPVEFEQLSVLLAGLGSFTAAAVCRSIGMTKGKAPAEAIETALLELADAARAAGKDKDAHGIYRYFLQRFPNSARAQTVRTELDR